MSAARALAVALLFFTGCAASEPEQPLPSSVEPATQMERTVVEPDSPLIAETAPTPTPSEVASDYDRKQWSHWIDADRDCQDTRTEVLIAESYEAIGFEDDRRCEIATGRWQCPYTGNIIAEVHLLDVDHLVPLANAHRSGASSWTDAQRRRYANDLEHAEHLVAVDHSANRSKADRGPEAWLPPLEDARCEYVRDWVAVKKRWQLGMSEAEATAVADVLEICGAGKVPTLPQARPRATTTQENAVERGEPTSTDAPTCCRTCKQGKACGDSCIAKASTCTKPPGCACDG